MKPQRAVRLTRLVDADPAYISHDGRSGMGVIFECPIHEDCWIGVPFSNPLDGGLGVSWLRGGAMWNRNGGSFADMTLTPSIHVLGEPDGCEWHGHITNGLFSHCDDAR